VACWYAPDMTADPSVPDSSPASPGLDRVALLERTIGASLERIWENVLDWEHLPWLHRGSFASIHLEEEGAWGWRARTASAARPDDAFVVEVRIDRTARRYVSRTVAGAGAGTEIWTFLDPTAEHETAIRVEFWMPGVPEDARPKVGEHLLALYERLWDEDESMMRERTARLEERGRRPGPAESRTTDLGPRDALIARLPTCVELGGIRWRIVSLDGALVAHDARCPHLFGPLVEGPVEGAATAEVRCPWHGYRFDVRTGASADGRRLRLRRPPRVDVDASSGHVRLVLD